MEVFLAQAGVPRSHGGGITTRSPMSRLWLGAVLIAAVAGILVLAAGPAGAATPTPASRVTFGIEPAAIGGAAVRPNVSISATPGAVVNDDVAAVNYSSVPLSLQIYPTDAVETAGGGFGLLPGNQKPTGVGSWIALAPGTATVQVPAATPTGPGRVVVPFVVHVPVKSTPGDHVGGIVASLQTAGRNAKGQRIVLDQRVGTRVFVLVAGPLARQLSVTNLHATYGGTANPVGKGQVKVSYLVNNTGNVDVGVEQSVAVSGVIGATHRVGVAKIPLLLPGTSVAESAVVSGVWPEVLLHQSVTARPVAVPGSSVPGLVPVTAGTSVWAVPWTLLALIVVVILAVILARRFRSRRAARHRAGEPADGAATEHPAREPAEASA
jgi:hypothetical protein